MAVRPEKFADVGTPRHGLEHSDTVMSAVRAVGEQDVVLRERDGMSLAQLASMPVAQVDVFFAIDSFAKNVARRGLCRRWLTDIQSMGWPTISHRFFSDGRLKEDENLADTVLQPEGNRRPRGKKPSYGWTRRWFFDLAWAVANIDFAYLIRGDDDGFQCASGFAALFGHLSQARPLLIFSSAMAPISRKKVWSLSSEESLHKWLWQQQGARLPDFEENWMLLSKAMSQSLLQVAAVKRPGIDQVLPDYLREVFISHLWPPKESILADVGRFDNDSSYFACGDEPPLENCHDGFNVWDAIQHGVCDDYEACAHLCREDGLLWLHHVITDWNEVSA